MKKLLITSALILALTLTTATFAESGGGLFGFFRGNASVKVGNDAQDQNDQHDQNEQDNEDHNGTMMNKDGMEFGINAGATIDVQKTRAATEIDRRVASLTKLETRLMAMVRVSDATKASLKATIDAQIKVLADLKAKIAADTDEATLKADIQSITKSYRIYMLVMPQGVIIAAADRVSTTADLMTTFGTKLDTRIAEAKTAGNNVAALESASADFKAKLADAKVQAAAAVTLSATLKPDNGDQAIMDANKKAMMDARAKLKAARDDLKAARMDAQTIVKGLKSFNIKVEGKIKSTNENQ